MKGLLQLTNFFIKINSMKYIILSFFFLLFLCNSIAQDFIKKTEGVPLTLTEMQRQFEIWRNNTDLKNAKHWKYYKRWENDMQFKTDGSGELSDPAIFIDEAVKFSNLKKSKSETPQFSLTAWTPTGPYNLPGNLTGYMQNGIGRINCIAFHPTIASTYYVGVAQGGVWKTTNNGVSWTPLTDNLPIDRISDIAIDPTNPDNIYISVCDFEYIDVALNLDARKRNTHYGLGVYKTTDGGINWTATGLSFQLTDGDASLIRKIIVNSTDGNQLVACGVSGMFTSMDAGATWNKSMDSLFWDLAQDPVNPNTLYASTGWLATSNQGSAGIYKSIDFGVTWTMLSTGIPSTGVVQRLKIAIAPSDNNCIYAAAVDAFDGSYGIYKSIDAGVSWNLIDPGLNMLEGNNGTGQGGQGTYDLGFTVNRSNKDIVYIGGVNIWESTDGATTFNPVSHWTLYYGPTLHGDIHFIESNPLTSEIFVCNDGGIYKTNQVTSQTWTDATGGTSWPTTWDNISDGMNISSFYRICSSKNTTGRLSAGAQDNATFYFDGTSWNTIFGGDGMDNYLDPLDDNNVVGSSQYGSFSFSQDNGVSTINSNPNVNSEAGEWTSPIVADYNNPGTIYIGFKNISASYDNGGSWSALSPFPSNGNNENEMSSIAVSNSNSNVIYATRRIRYELNSPSTIYTTTNGGSSWTNITAGLPDSLYFTSSEVSQTSPNIAYVTLAGFEANQKVYKTSDGGNSWQNISYNLPNIPVNCVKTTPSTNQLIITTDLGIYQLNTITNTWINISAGLPNVIITDIEFNPSLDKIYISTFGRGIWENTLSNLSIYSTDNLKETDLNYASFELYPTINNGNFTIHLTDENEINNSVELEIIDINGQLVYKACLTGKMDYIQSINLKSGMYFAKIKGEKVKAVKRFIVE